jgi:hypothetical protein
MPSPEICNEEASAPDSWSVEYLCQARLPVDPGVTVMRHATRNSTFCIIATCLKDDLRL